jgi:Ca2+-binding EF-hand superfamily protein
VLDTDGDGKVSLPELADYLNAPGASGDPSTA